MKNETRKVCLFGAALDTGNMGVSALAASLIALIRAAQPTACISLLVGNRSAESQTLSLPAGKVQVEIVNYRLSPRARLQEHLFWILWLALLYRLLPLPGVRRRILRKNRWLRHLLAADFVGDIRGGDSFSDLYGLGKFFIGSIPCLTALLLGKPLVLLPQTYGPFAASTAKMLARYILASAAAIYSRDKTGLQTVRRLIGADSAAPVRFCPDVAFTLPAAQPADPAIAPPFPDQSSGPVVGININGLMYNGGYSRDNMFALKCDYRRFARQLLLKFCAETPAEILLVPHTFGAPGNVNSDPDACAAVRASLPPEVRDRVHLITCAHDQHRIKGLIGRCDFFVGSRMHACIAALSQGIPTAGVAYSRKFHGVFRSVGAGMQVIDAREVDHEAAVRLVFRHYENRDAIRAGLRATVSAARDRIKATFSELFAGDMKLVERPELHGQD